jgi:hypothetical protein
VGLLLPRCISIDTGCVSVLNCGLLLDCCGSLWIVVALCGVVVVGCGVIVDRSMLLLVTNIISVHA